MSCLVSLSILSNIFFFLQEISVKQEPKTLDEMEDNEETDIEQPVMMDDETDDEDKDLSINFGLMDSQNIKGEDTEKTDTKRSVMMDDETDVDEELSINFASQDDKGEDSETTDTEYMGAERHFNAKADEDLSINLGPNDSQGDKEDDTDNEDELSLPVKFSNLQDICS